MNISPRFTLWMFILLIVGSVFSFFTKSFDGAIYLNTLVIALEMIMLNAKEK